MMRHFLKESRGNLSEEALGWYPGALYEAETLRRTFNVVLCCRSARCGPDTIPLCF